MRIGAWLLLASMTTACGSGFLRQYEYEEEMYVSLDGSATLYVHTSVAALNALRGASFDVSPAAQLDRDQVRAYFTSPATHVAGRVRTSRRQNRQFVHVRVDVDDIRKLDDAPPFAWSVYSFERKGEAYTLLQKVGPSAAKDVDSVTAVNWTGNELVAFRLHIPSKIVYHNAGKGNLRRGNILVWEQPLADRLRGVPLEIDARMETESILYRTLWLFGGTIVAVALSFGIVIWMVVRGGRKSAASRIGQT